MAHRLACALVTVAAALVAGARTFTWTGRSGADAGWADGGNWDRDGAVPAAGDTVVLTNAAVAVTRADQPILDVIREIRIRGAAEKLSLFAAAGETVTLPCPVVFEDGSPYLGKTQSGTLTVKGLIDASAGGTIELMGTVVLSEGATVKAAKSSTFFGPQGTGSQVRFAAPLRTATSFYPTFRTRGTTEGFAFDCADAWAFDGSALIIGTLTAWGGPIDLNGFDQKLAKLSMSMPTSSKYLSTACLTSARPATLTLTQGTVVGNNSDALLWAPLRGAVSVKLASANGGTLTITNLVGYPSETSGAVISAAGTVRLADGTTFMKLGRLVKEGTGSIDVGAVSLADAELSLSGTGKMTLRADLEVLRAKVWNESSRTFDYLAPESYAVSDLPLHLAGKGRLIVRRGRPAGGIPLKTNDHWIVVRDVCLDATVARPLAFVPSAQPPDESIREVAVAVSSSAPAEESDLHAALADGARFGSAVVCVGEELRYVTLQDGCWVTNGTRQATLDGSETVVCRLNAFDGTASYRIRTLAGEEVPLSDFSQDDLNFSELRFFGEGFIGAIWGSYASERLFPGLFFQIK